MRRPPDRLLCRGKLGCPLSDALIRNRGGGVGDCDIAAHLLAVYNNYDFAPATELMRDAANLTTIDGSTK